MNTFGKILVVLNLLFALVTGGFIVFSYATRFRYDQALVKQREEAAAAKAFLKSETELLAPLDAKLKAEIAAHEKSKYELSDRLAEKDAKIVELESDKATLKAELDKAKTAVEVAEKERERRNEEVKNLGEALKLRESMIIDLEGKVSFFQAEAVSLKAKADSLQARNENLLEENKRLAVALARERTGGGTGDGPVKLPHEPNPPTALVNGTIERVDGDLVTLTVGSDHGLKKNHTMEAFRLDPEATYLGMIRIVEVHHHSSIGRLERTSISRRIPLRAGDKVISELKAR